MFLRDLLHFLELYCSFSITVDCESAAVEPIPVSKHLSLFSHMKLILLFTVGLWAKLVYERSLATGAVNYLWDSIVLIIIIVLLQIMVWKYFLPWFLIEIRWIRNSKVHIRKSFVRWLSYVRVIVLLRIRHLQVLAVLIRRQVVCLKLKLLLRVRY